MSLGNFPEEKQKFPEPQIKKKVYFISVISNTIAYVSSQPVKVKICGNSSSRNMFTWQQNRDHFKKYRFKN